LIAFDKSMRQKTVEGHLFVEVSPISKACVSPYLGKEIPDCQRLGLQADKIYYLLRDPVELAKAASTFRGKPILIVHKETSADKHPKELTVGALGTEVEFNAPYLETSLCIWTDDAIAGIETRQQVQISSGYRYTADMTPGEYEGEKYDGVMRDIIGNHVALVDVGRAGPDVLVLDKQPIEMRATKMPKIRLSRTGAAVNSVLRAVLTPKLAQDAAIGSLGALLVNVKAATLRTQRPAIVAAVKKHMQGKLAQDARLDDEDINKALDAMDDPELAGDEDDDDDDEDAKKKKAAMDAPPDVKGAPEPPTKAAMDAAIADKVAEARRSIDALYTARAEVLPVVGQVALDSAEEVYKFALDKQGVDIAGVHPSAYRAMFSMLQANKKTTMAAPVNLATDSASAAKVVEMFPGLKRFHQ
jgi:hypothetical protein